MSTHETPPTFLNTRKSIHHYHHHNNYYQDHPYHHSHHCQRQQPQQPQQHHHQQQQQQQQQHYIQDRCSHHHQSLPNDHPRKNKKTRTQNRNNSNPTKKNRGPVYINVNGRLFVLSKSTCIRIPVLQGMLSHLKQSETLVQDSALPLLTPHSSTSRPSQPEELFFERNSTVFAAVVDYVQNNELHVPPHVCPKLFARDLSFWGFDIDEVESCCFSGVVHFLWEQDRLAKFHGFLRPQTQLQGEVLAPNDPHTYSHSQLLEASITRIVKFRHIVWKILDEPFSGRIARAYFYIMCLFIMTSFFIIAADTVEHFKTDPNQSAPWITWLAHACAAYLYIDYFLRIVFHPNLRRFCFDFINITDGLAVLSSIAKSAAEVWLVPDDSVSRTWVDAISSLQLLRILRLLRPMSKVIGFRLIYFTLKCSFHELLLVFMLLLFLTMIFSSLLYYLGDRKSIKSIPHAMWFSLTTMTTVGYGDIVPGKARTKVIGSVVAVFGVIFMSMTMPIMVSNFNLLYINAVVCQPAAISKVHRDLERANEASSTKVGTTPRTRQASTARTQADQKPSASSGGLHWFRSCCPAVEEQVSSYTHTQEEFRPAFHLQPPEQPPALSVSIMNQLSTIKPSLRYGRAATAASSGVESASSGVESDGRGSDADGESSNDGESPRGLDLSHRIQLATQSGNFQERSWTNDPPGR